MTEEGLSKSPPPAASETVRTVPSPLRRLGWLLLQAGTVLAITLSLAGFAGARGWRFDLVCHFRVQYLGALLIAAGLFLWGRKCRWTAIAVAGVVLNASVIVPLYFGRAPAGAEGPRLRILSFNVLAHNLEYDQVRELIKSESPDVAVFFEADSRWPPELSQLADLYPYQRFRPQEGHMGVALLSRIPFEHAEFYHLDPACPAGLMRLRIGDHAVTIIATHVFPPTAAWKTARRNAQLEEVAKLVRAETNPVIVVGDYNATSWSSAFRQLRAGTGLRDSRRGFGVQPSWPAQARLLRIPIDHCLASPELRVLDRRLGPPCGSDHLPLIIDLAFSTRSGQK